MRNGAAPLWIARALMSTRDTSTGRNTSLTGHPPAMANGPDLVLSELGGARERTRGTAETLVSEGGSDDNYPNIYMPHP